MISQQFIKYNQISYLPLLQLAASQEADQLGPNILNQADSQVEAVGASIGLAEQDLQRKIIQHPINVMASLKTPKIKKMNKVFHFLAKLMQRLFRYRQGIRISKQASKISFLLTIMISTFLVSTKRGDSNKLRTRK